MMNRKQRRAANARGGSVVRDASSVQGLFDEALRHHHAGRLGDADRLYRQVLRGDPRHADGLHLLGVVASQLGRHDSAIDLIGKAIAIDAGAAAYHSDLGVAVYGLGRLDQAVACFRRALDLKQNYPEAHNNLGNALKDQGRLDEAAACYRTALGLKPDYPEACTNLGVVLKDLGRLDEAVACHRTALRLKPDYARAHTNLGSAVLEQGRLDEAVACHRTALDLEPDFPGALVNLGNALKGQGRLDEAAACWRRALAIQPDEPMAHNNLGLLLGEQGAIEDAVAQLEKAISCCPGQPQIYLNLAQYRRFVPDDPTLAALEEMAAAEHRLGEAGRMHLHFALGKALDDVGRWDEAFAHFVAGNALQRRRVRYDEAATLGLLARLPATVTAELLAARRGQGHDDPTPVFVVGMPRSGTTLVEQILASHPLVFGANELDVLDRVIAGRFGPEAAGLDALPGLPGADLAELGRRYVAEVRPLAPQARHIVDKMPANFRHAGLIHLILPRARIIHVRRDPVDTCLSCFSKLFTGQSLPQTYDLDELARYTLAYRAVMAHWREVLPREVLLEVDYEAVVDDLPGQARRLLDHCGLPWDDACLAFHRTARPVRTASAAQVRRPLYRDAVGHWHAYAAAAERLAAAMDTGP
jgi:tetratricopeptide (TPR) repeat protein